MPKMNNVEYCDIQIQSAETMIKRILEKYKIPKGDVEKVLAHAKAIEIAATTKVKEELRLAEYKNKFKKENKDHEKQDLLQPNRLTV